MAIDLSILYPGQVDTGDPEYPYGRPRNQSVLGDGTGTPWEKELVKDVVGFEQALLAAGRLTPSGTADKVGASQYLDAIRRMVQPLAALTWGMPVFIGQNMLPIDPASNAAVTISPNINDLATDKALTTPDGGSTWAQVTIGSPTGVIFLCAAMDPAGAKGIITGSKAGGTDIQVSSTLGSYPLGSFAPITPPGTPIDLKCALFDPVNSRFIVTGNTGSAPYIATCELADLTTWTQRTVPASITGAVAALSLARIGNTIVASWATQTKVAYSTDGGVTWTASTTSLNSQSYRVEAGETKFLAASKSSAHMYNSTDGITWTALSNLARPELDFERWGLKFLGGVFILRCISAVRFYYSLNDGVSWVEVPEQNRTWSSFGVIRNRLLQWRHLPNGSDIDVWQERSQAIGLPGT